MMKVRDDLQDGLDGLSEAGLAEVLAFAAIVRWRRRATFFDLGIASVRIRPVSKTDVRSGRHGHERPRHQIRWEITAEHD